MYLEACQSCCGGNQAQMFEDFDTLFRKKIAAADAPPAEVVGPQTPR